MKLYKEHNVNPASGCLPMLLQFPFFLVLYDVMQRDSQHRHHSGQVVDRRWSENIGTRPRDCGAQIHRPHHPDVQGHRGCSRAVECLRHGLLPEAVLPPQLDLRRHPLLVVGAGVGGVCNICK